MMKSLAILSLTLTAAMSARAEWDQFRGPQGSGVAEGSVTLKWSSHEHLKWKVKLPGPGTSSPIVVGNRVLVTCWSGYADGGKGGMEQLIRHLVCIDGTRGTVLWDCTVPAVLPEDPYEGMITEHGYASSTPVSDGQSVFVFFGKTGVLAFDMEGKQLWQTSVGVHSDDRHWGSAASPVLYTDLLMVNALTEGGAVVALQKATGKPVWKAGEGIQLAYGTPVTSKQKDVLVSVREQVWGLNPDNGQFRWRAVHGLGSDVAANVLLAENGTAYVFGGSPNAGSAAIKLDDGRGDIGWRGKTSSYVPLPVYHEGRLYVINDQGFALCIDAKTGTEIYRERVLDRTGKPRRGGGGQPFYASPVLVNGRIYCPSRRNGTFVIAARPVFELLAVNVFEDDESPFNASPAVDDNRLFLRSDLFLYCISE